MGAKDLAGGLWARLYDLSMRRGERAGMQQRRRALLEGAHGRTLEIGAGTGLHAALYPPGLDRLVLTEPDPHMAGRLRRRAGRAEVVVAGAEALPFADASFDTVVATLVLCTVPDPAAALAEVRRVLADDGALLFIEHVRSDDPRVARRQDRLRRPWAALAGGCRCNQPTLALMAAAGLDTAGVEHHVYRRAPAIVRRLAVGSAV